LPALSREMPIPVWGVIDPGIEAARRATKSGYVGVIGTKGTIASEVYQSKLANAGMRVWARACPLFVHLVEEGLADSEDAVALARHYLADVPPVDTMILGCTHYPVLSPVIQRVLGPTVRLVSSAEVTAEVVAAAVDQNSNSDFGKVTHYVTGGVHAYMHTAETIGGVEGRVFPVDVTRLSDAGLTVGPGRV
jgi:glutamate racemase